MKTILIHQKTIENIIAKEFLSKQGFLEHNNLALYLGKLINLFGNKKPRVNMTKLGILHDFKDFCHWECVRISDKLSAPEVYNDLFIRGGIKLMEVWTLT